MTRSHGGMHRTDEGGSLRFRILMVTSPIEQRRQGLKTEEWQLVSHKTVGFVATGVMQQLEPDYFGG